MHLVVFLTKMAMENFKQNTCTFIYFKKFCVTKLDVGEILHMYM